MNISSGIAYRCVASAWLKGPRCPNGKPRSRGLPFGQLWRAYRVLFRRNEESRLIRTRRLALP